jgi:hypothetical protein
VQVIRSIAEAAQAPARRMTLIFEPLPKAGLAMLRYQPLGVGDDPELGLEIDFSREPHSRRRLITVEKKG